LQFEPNDHWHVSAAEELWGLGLTSNSKPIGGGWSGYNSKPNGQGWTLIGADKALFAIRDTAVVQFKANCQIRVAVQFEAKSGGEGR